MGKRYGIGREGYPSGRTGAASRDWYISNAKSAKKSSNKNKPKSK